jgi:membrane-associated protease RseP (regulator of RpoE activity)
MVSFVNANDFPHKMQLLLFIFVLIKNYLRVNGGIMKYIGYIFFSFLFVIGGATKSAAVPEDDKKITIVWQDDEEEKAWLGVQIKDLTRKLRQELDTKARYGVVVDEVVDNSPAEEAGLEPGDVIVKLDNKTTKKTEDLLEQLSKKKPEDEVGLEVMRGRERIDITVILGNRSKREITIGNPLKGFRFPGFAHGAYLGVEVQSMDQHLAEYFDVDEDEGILVTSVEEDSPAEQAEIHSGDVLIALDGEEITDTESITDILSEYEEGDEVELEYVRKGRRHSTVLVLEEKPFSWQSFSGHKPDVYVPQNRDFYFYDKNKSDEKEDRKWHRMYDDEMRDELEKEKEEYQHELEDMRKEMKEMREEMKKLKEDLN